VLVPHRVMFSAEVRILYTEEPHLAEGMNMQKKQLSM